MSGDETSRVVLDCTVFARALINPKGPAGLCVYHAQQGSFTLILSEYVLAEIRELPGKIKPNRGVSVERVEALIQDVSINAESWADVLAVFTHPIDPDDSHYVNLAHAAGASHILTNDKHLLALRDSATPMGQAFRKQFPHLSVATPEEYLRVLEPRKHPADVVEPTREVEQGGPEGES